EAGRDGLDRAALAGGVATLEQHDDLQPGVLDPLLEAVELDIEARELRFVELALEASLVRHRPGGGGTTLAGIAVTLVAPIPAIRPDRRVDRGRGRGALG